MGKQTLHSSDKAPGGTGPQTVECPKCRAEFVFYIGSLPPGPADTVDTVDTDQNVVKYIRIKAEEALSTSCPGHVEEFTY